MFQQTSIIGHVGRDPEMRYTPSGDPVTNFSVATSKRWTDAQGQRQEKTVWWKVTAWRRLAETCQEYVKKGMLVSVQGELQEPQVWQDREGNHRASLDLTARNVLFLSARDSEGTRPAEGPELEEELAF